MQTLEHPTFLPIEDDDYGHALVHLAWYREGQRRFLLFGFVELFPSELPPPEPTELLDLPVRPLGRQHHVYLRRFAMTVGDALAWYADCRAGIVALPEPGWIAGQPPNKRLATAAFDQEPPWPHLIATNTLPFQAWGTVRTHHLLQANPCPEAKRPLGLSAAIGWLSERLFFDLAEHWEWLGSVSLITPDPVLRGVHHTLAVETDGRESSDLHFIARAGHRVDGLTLHFGEHRPSGLASFRTVALTSPYVRLPHVGRTVDVGLTVVCPRRGVLEQHEPTGFLRSIHLEASMVSSRKEVVVPATPGRDGETYVQAIHSPGFTSMVGDANETRPITAHLRSAACARERKDEVERFAQELFHGNQEEARKFVRSLIARARRRVVIVDPYFATAELFRFALATSRADIDVRILTSADILRTSDRVAPDKEAGEVLLKQVEGLGRHARFEILVMTGSPPPIHDRFLVIDDDVWLSGNSLHSIGERAGIMIKLPAPGDVIQLIDAIVRDGRVKPLREWVANRLAASGAEQGP